MYFIGVLETPLGTLQSLLFKGNYLLADKLLYVRFCAEIYLGRVYIAVQDSAVTFANAITRVFDFFSQLLCLSYILMGGKSAPRIFLK